MKTFKKFLSLLILSVFCIGNLSLLNFVSAAENEFTVSLTYYDSDNHTVIDRQSVNVKSWTNYTVNAIPKNYSDSFTCTPKPASVIVTSNVEITVDCSPKVEENNDEGGYNLIINYVDSSSFSPVVARHVEKVAPWTSYSVPSPNKKSRSTQEDIYLISQDVVSGVMPSHDVEITVLYTRKSVEKTPTDKKNDVILDDEKVTPYDTPYDEALGISTSDRSLSSAIDGWDVVNSSWAELFNEQVNSIIGYVIDFFIVIWIVVAFIGWYKIMTSEDEKNMKEWIKLVVFGVLWIIIMVSARFLATALVWDNGIISEEFANANPNHQPNWIKFADNLYNTIMYPFIKVALYFVVWVLFFVMAGKVISFVTATDDSAKKKAGWIIIRCVVWILIVMWSKQIVEAVMWNQDDVLKVAKGGESAPAWIDEQWNPILEFGSIPLIAQVINRVMGLTMLAIVVLIIIQWYKIFTKPDDPKTREGLKKTILYIVIWILVIGAAYVISSVLVLNNVPVDIKTS